MWKEFGNYDVWIENGYVIRAMFYEIGGNVYTVYPYVDKGIGYWDNCSGVYKWNYFKRLWNDGKIKFS